MEAPKLRGMFRNVRTKPRSFVFKSRHLSDDPPQWGERKRRIESEVAMELGERVPEQNTASSIRFRKGGSVRNGARKANVRVVLIGVVLLWITWKMIVWAETTEFGEMLEFIRDNG
ncbi:MAG: hypothetical protein QMB09_06705 [Flavobacteriales bacterium]